MILEDLTGATFREWGGVEEGVTDEQLDAELAWRWGYVLRDASGALAAIGGVRWFSAGACEHGPEITCLAWFEARCCSIWVHRQARFFLSALVAAGQRDVWAIPDPTIPKAQAWLKRLGFQPHENGVWRLGVFEASCRGGAGLRPAL